MESSLGVDDGGGRGDKSEFEVLGFRGPQLSVSQSLGAVGEGLFLFFAHLHFSESVDYIIAPWLHTPYYVVHELSALLATLSTDGPA